MSPELRAYLDHTDNETYPGGDADRDEADRLRALIPPGELAAHARAKLEAAYAAEAAEDAKPKPDPRPGHYYVTATDRSAGDKWWPLCGPFPTHQQALDVVDEVRAYAQEADPRAHFYYFGTHRDAHPDPLKCPITMPMLEAFRAARNAPPPPKKSPARKRKVIGSAA